MITLSLPYPPTKIENRIAGLIQLREIIKLQDLIDRSGLDGHTVHAVLQRLMSERSIECLQPASRQGHGDAEQAEPDPQLTYYRWRSATDRDYLWQRALGVDPVRPNRPCPLADCEPPPYFSRGHRTTSLLALLRLRLTPRLS